MKSDCSEPVKALGLCGLHHGRDLAARIKADPVRHADQKRYYREWKRAELLRQPGRVRARHNAWVAANSDRVRLSDKRKMRRRRAAPRLPFTVDQLAARIRYWGECCWICRAPWEAIDHVKPIAKGGWHALMNIRPICTPCNSRKRDRWPYQIPVAA